MERKPIVTFDFDGTLTKPEVQEYFKELVERGVEVWIVTARYDDLQKRRYPQNPTNEDLWQIVDKLGHHRHKVRFMNFISKSIYLRDTEAIWHLDDDFVELDFISRLTKVKAINVNDAQWKEHCETILEQNN